MQFINSLNDFIWSYIILVALVGCALYFTIRTRGMQFRMIPEMVRLMLGRDVKKKQGIGSFQAFSVSLASRVGTGNLAGVASAIFIGGPGAVFWMWIMALLGAATAFVEATLAQLYKKKGKVSYYGGPAYYMEQGLGCRWMGIIFSVLMPLTFGFTNQLAQANTMVSSLNESFGFDPLIMGIILGIIVIAIIFGGIKRISQLLSYFVPFMALGFILLTIVIMGMNIQKFPEVIKTIIACAFGARQVAGATIGMAILQGVKRGLFSNEAGEGSAPNAAAIAETSHPVKQGLIQSLGVYIDTILICTCTAFIVIVSGLYDSGADGIVLTMRATESLVGIAGKYFIMAAIMLFAFSTVIANYYYGETNIWFISGKKIYITIFRVLTGLFMVMGAMISLQDIWSLIDLGMAFLTLTNLIAILLLSNQAFRLLKDYISQKKAGKEPVFHKSTMPDIADKLECWD